MNNTLLLSQLDLLATAPGGVAKLRELILTLAVQGKLVPQDPVDEPASELLKRIRAEKDRLIAEGKIKRDKPLAPIGEEEQPFELPVGWELVRIDGVAEVQGGIQKTPLRRPVKNHHPYLRVANVQRDAFKLDEIERYELTDEELARWTLVENDLLIVEGNGSEYEIGRCAVWAGQIAGCVYQNHLIRVRCLDSQCVQFLKLFLNSPSGTDEMKRLAITTSGLYNLSVGKIRNFAHPLPPLPEQARIVTRVEELMRVCDALEAQGQQQAAHHRQLVQTLLGTLTSTDLDLDLDPDSATPTEPHAPDEPSPQPAPTQNAWQRVAAHFDTLLDRPSAVDALEQTILQLAVRGQLVPQDPADEPASELLKRIRTEKDRLIAEGKIKRDKPLAPIGEDEQPFALPRGWEWVRVADICSLVTDGEHLTPERCDDPSAVPLVTAKNVRSEAMDYRQTDFVPRAVAEQCWRRCKPETGDILMVSVGATLGRLTVLRETTDMVLVRSVTVLRPVHVAVDVSYLALHLMAPATQVEIWANVKQSAQPCLYLAKSAALTVALPPLPEQTRIVARVAHLRRLCAELRQRLSQSQTTQAALAGALVTDTISGDC